MTGFPNIGYSHLETLLRSQANDFVDSDDSSLDSFQVVPEFDPEKASNCKQVDDEPLKKKERFFYNNVNIYLEKVPSIPMDGDDDNDNSNLQSRRSNNSKVPQTSSNSQFNQNVIKNSSKIQLKCPPSSTTPASVQISGLFSKNGPSFLSIKPDTTMTTFSASSPAEAVAALTLHETNAGQPVPVKEVKFPIETMSDFEQLEKDLNHNRPLKLNLIHRLAKAGGTSYVICTKNCLTMLLSTNVSSQLNWAGRNGKKAFKNYLIQSVLFDAVRLNFPDSTDYELKEPVQNWFSRRPRGPNKRIVKGPAKSKGGQKMGDTFGKFVDISSHA